jgi:multidrug efflux pump subunit AcrB
MNIVATALRRPITVLMAVISIILTATLALTSMKQDIFPNLNIPAIYVIQGYGGMAPDQMEGYLVSTYELFFLYVPGIEHIESRSVQNVAVMKIYFHPETDMSAAMACIVAMCNRATSLMPKGTLNPFILRFDPGCLPVGQLVLSSQTQSVQKLQDLAYVRVRSALATVPGVQAPPPFGGNIRTIVINVDANKLRRYNISGDEIVNTLATGNVITPAGNVRTGSLMRIAPVDTDLPDIHMLDYLPVRTGPGPQIFIRDIGTVEDSDDILAGYALFQDRRTVYLPVVKKADSSTVEVVNAVKKALPDMQAVLPTDVKISYEFDQSKYVRDAINDVAFEGMMGTLLPGLMILLFLRDIRSTAIVVTTIPCSLLLASVLLWATGQTINIQTLSGLALAIGILVDEATVVIENVHSHIASGQSVSRSVYEASIETMVPRFLAMLTVVAVFVPSFFMTGITRNLFVPLSMAVGFTMMASFTFSTTLVPVMCVWILKGKSHSEKKDFTDTWRHKLESLVTFLMPRRNFLIPIYLFATVSAVVILYNLIGQEMFPDPHSTEFRVRISAPTGTRVEVLEAIVRKTIDEIKAEAGPGVIDKTLGYAGQQPPMFPISSAYLWTSGPHQAVMDLRMKEGTNIDLNAFKDKVRRRLAKALPGVLFSFEPGDIVSQVMNLGSPTPICINVRGHDLIQDRIFAKKIKAEIIKIPYIRDLQWGQPQEYPTCDIKIDRELAGQLGITPLQIGNSLLPAYFSSRFILLSFWKDRNSGVSYQVQVQVPQDQIKSKDDIDKFPTMGRANMQHPLIGDVAKVEYGTTIGEYDRYNMMRMVSLTANLSGKDLGNVGKMVQEAVKRVGAPPRGVFVDVVGQIPLLKNTFEHLFGGLVLAVIVIFLMLSAYFQAPRMVLAVLSTVPAILTGVLLALFLTGTTLNVESFMGAIMSIGIGISNAILLVIFAEKHRQEGMPADKAAIAAAEQRMRPILMTSFAMIAGMIPMALSAGTGAPLGRAVIGGLACSTLSALTLLPLVFAIIQEKVPLISPSLHPDDRGE